MKARGKEKIATRRCLLIVDDEKDAFYSFQRLLADEDYDLISATSGKEGVSAFQESRPDVVLMDVRMEEMDGLAALEEMRKLDPKALVIIMTAYSSTHTAIEAMKAGAYDYVLKPFDVAKIKQVIHDAMRSSESMKSPVSYQPLLSREDYAQGIIGKSEPMQKVYKEIGRVAAKNIPVLITGETGTGKELVARAIYHHSERSQKRFLAINCGAIPENLIESELFGHERGAFTNAYARRIGKFEVAQGGTIFLDEIGELLPAIQTKLLRVLQEREIERLGGSEPISVDVRILAATNRDLNALIREGAFRRDLFYRLHVVEIKMPPLRERKEDIPLLVEYFLDRVGADYGEGTSASDGAIEMLQAYDWPGNVRELENALKNSLVRVKGGVLLPGDLHLGENGEGSAASGAAGVSSPPRAEAAAAGEGLEALMRTVFEEVRRLREQGEAEDAFDLVERCLVHEALKHFSGNQVRAARLLGITRSTLRKRMAKYGLQVRSQVESKS